ncbi:MAG: GIDE domain-containing protein [Candidatus Woesearchaeota archaeon]
MAGLSTSGQLMIGSIVSFIGGLLLFFLLGFKLMKKVAIIKDTPTSKIRSMAIGLVEITGKPFAEKYLITPFSKSNCVYYRYEIKEYRRYTTRDSKGHTHTHHKWVTVANGGRNMAFFLKDDTGQAYVNPNGANFDIPLKRLFLQKAGLFGNLGNLVNTLKNWDSYMKGDVSAQALNLVPIDVNKGITFNRVGDRKYYEYFLEPDEETYILGTAANDSSAPNNVLVKKGENEPTFIISNKSEKELLGSLKTKMILSFIGGGLLIIIGIILFLYNLGLF